jgi:hypothetical protein
MKHVFGEEWEAAKKALKDYWMHHCDEDALLIDIRILRTEMMASIFFDIIPLTMSGAVYRANRMMGWWWEE